MMLDKKSVDLLLRLPDEQLMMIIKKLASDAGVDISSVSISKEQLSGIRQALSVATDSDLKRAGEIISNLKNGSKS